MGKKRGIIIILVVLIPFNLLGCVGRMELNDYGIVTLVGHDKEGVNTVITAEVVNPVFRREATNMQTSIITETKGITVFEAIRNITLVFDRKLYFPHTQAIIFSESMAKEGILKYLDFWERDYEVKLNTNIIICRDGKSSELFIKPPGVEMLLGNYIKYLAENNKYSGKSVEVTLRELTKRYYEEGSKVYVASVIRREGKEKTAGKGGNYQLNIEGLAVFVEDKLAGYLEGDETMAYNIIQNKMKSGTIVASSEEAFKFYTVKILSSKAKNSIEIKDDGARIQIDVNIEAMMNEIMTGDNLRDPKAIEKIEKDTESKVKKMIEKVIKKSQDEFKADIFQFYSNVYRKDYDNWVKVKDKWEEVFCNSNVEVSVKAKINRDALLDDSFIRRETVR